MSDPSTPLIDFPDDAPLAELARACGLDPERDFRGRNFKRYDFRGADLRGIDFSMARLQGARFDGARIAGAYFDQAILESPGETSANLSSAADYSLFVATYAPSPRPPINRSHLVEGASYFVAPGTTRRYRPRRRRRQRPQRPDFQMLFNSAHWNEQTIHRHAMSVSLEQILKDNCLVLHGSRGVGKTATLRWLERELHKTDTHIPIFVRSSPIYSVYEGLASGFRQLTRPGDARVPEIDRVLQEAVSRRYDETPTASPVLREFCIRMLGEYAQEGKRPVILWDDWHNTEGINAGPLSRQTESLLEDAKLSSSIVVIATTPSSMLQLNDSHLATQFSKVEFDSITLSDLHHLMEMRVADLELRARILSAFSQVPSEASRFSMRDALEIARMVADGNDIDRALELYWGERLALILKSDHLVDIESEPAVSGLIPILDRLAREPSIKVDDDLPRAPTNKLLILLLSRLEDVGLLVRDGNDIAFANDTLRRWWQNRGIK